MTIAEADLAAGERVVYPNQGICRVVGVTELEIGGHRETFIKLAREDDNATVMVPRSRLQKVGLRRIAESSELEQVIKFLGMPVQDPELDWKIRQKAHGEKMSEGGLLGLAEVVKGLTALSDIRPLPPKERELYDNARHLLVAEVAVSAGISETGAEDAIDLALFPPGKIRVKPTLPSSAPRVEALDLDLGDDLPGLELDDDLPLDEPEESEQAIESTVSEEDEAEEATPEEEAPPPPKAPKAKAKAKATPKAEPAKKAAKKPAKAAVAKASKAPEKKKPATPKKATAKTKK